VIDAAGPSHEQRPMIVSRDALIGVLDRATDKRLTIISAPPGSGKSALLRAWREHISSSSRVAAVAVRRGETDPQRFWLAVVQAIRRAIDPSTVADAPTATQEFDGAAILDRALDELAAAVDPIIVVIDDLHELHSPEGLAQLQEFVERLPPPARLVMTARRDPDLRLHQIRLDGELSEIRGADLRFSVDEARAMLEASGLEVSEDLVSRLHERTEGWAAGLRLAAISLEGHPEPEAFVAAFSGSDRTVADYLIAEMLERQPEPVRRLLLRTSLLDRVNGALADRMIGSERSQEILRGLEDADAFVVSLDPERTWFRYHHMFSDLLRLELGRTAPDEIAALHRRAAVWLAETGNPVEAIRHAQQAEDWELATRLLVDHALNLTLDGEDSTVRELLAQFAPAVIQADPELILVSAADQIAQGALQEASDYLTLAESMSTSVAPERQSHFSVSLAVTRLLLARRRGDFSDVVAQVEFLAGPGEIRSAADVALGSELRAVALMNLGIVEMWSLRLDDAWEHLNEGAKVARRIGRPYLEAGCLAHAGFAGHGESFAKAREICREAIRLAEAHHWDTDHVIAPALAALGGTLVFSGEFQEAERLLDRAELALRADVEPATELLLHLARGMLEAGVGRFEEALARFRAAERMQSLLVTQHALAVQVQSFRISMQLRLGHLDDASTAAEGIEAQDFPWGESLTALAAIRLARGQPDEAIRVLGPALDGTAPVIHAFTKVEAHMVAALAHVELADRRASEAAVEAALELAEPDRLVLPFAMADGRGLLERHPRHSTAHAHLITEVLDILGGASAGAEPSVTPPSEPLSPPELRVLRFLPTNLTVPEIASELFLSVNTVKTHMRRIYAKLDAHTRSDAVRRARALGLLAGAPR
jgi:LuxR family maltose regulon positive regulatory protein